MTIGVVTQLVNASNNRLPLPSSCSKLIECVLSKYVVEYSSPIPRE
jgi:hypothetical protein